MKKFNKVSADVKRIEQEIVNFLVESPIFIGRIPKSIVIKAYFVTRKSLTQKTLKKLTGYSSGTISQELRNMIKQGIIEKSQVSSSGEITYTMNSIRLGLINSNINTINETAIYMENILLGIKSELEKQKKELEELRGFQEIYKIVNLFLYSVGFSKSLLGLLEEEL